jgi:hypothetical protein
MRRRAKAAILFVLAMCVVVGGCGPTVHTRTASWPNGTMRAKETYYVNSEGWKKMHGVSTYWDERGAVVAEGTWKDGMPMDGVCWIPAAGDAGSVGGLGHFERYKDGKALKEVAGRP